MNFPSAADCAAYSAAFVAVVTAVTTLYLTIKNGGKIAEVHAMISADATPAALDTVKPTLGAAMDRAAAQKLLGEGQTL